MNKHYNIVTMEIERYRVYRVIFVEFGIEWYTADVWSPHSTNYHIFYIAMLKLRV